MMERALEVTIDYVKQRKAFGKALIDFQNTQFELAECKTDATIAKVFVDHCIGQHVEGKLDTATASMAKYCLTDTAGRSDRPLPAIVRRLWLYGRIPDLAHVPRRRVLRIYAGTNEIMKLLIARSLVRRGFDWQREAGGRCPMHSSTTTCARRAAAARPTARCTR